MQSARRARVLSPTSPPPPPPQCPPRAAVPRLSERTPAVPIRGTSPRRPLRTEFAMSADISS
eukprot:6213736-Pleurochrysis_carterae.AAC.1